MRIPAPSHAGVDRDRLRLHWRTCLADAEAGARPEAVAAQGDLLIGRWGEPHRRYHDLNHLDVVLSALDMLSGSPGGGGRAPATTRLAAWFHDAVYAGVPGRDERDSAGLAVQVLTELLVPQVICDEVSRLVLVTADHRVDDGDEAAALLVDADLAVLAFPPQDYARYTQAVRAEYAHVPDSLFAAGRRAVLESLLALPRLFHTDAAQGWEGPARANLRAEIEALRAR